MFVLEPTSGISSSLEKYFFQINKERKKKKTKRESEARGKNRGKEKKWREKR